MRSVGTGDTMRVLLVEDQEEDLEEIVPELEKITGAPKNLIVAKSRDSAIAALNTAISKDEFFDFFILDLKIPLSDDKKGDIDVENGKAVFNYVQTYAPRTPVYILTGVDARPVISHLLLHAQQVDVWGDRQPLPTVQLKFKENQTELLEELHSIAQRVAKTDDIEIVSRDLNPPLTLQQIRVLRIFARRRESCSCNVLPLAGGLSSSRVFRVTARDNNGNIRIVAAGKIANVDTVDDEVERFDQHLPRLKAGAFPAKVEVVRSGAGLTAGVFYWLLNGDSESLFSLLATNPDQAASVVTKVQNLMKPWLASEATTQIADIRRRLVGDEEATNLIRDYNLTWAAELETKRIQTRWACLHGDLHGGNLLVDGNGTPLLIDFSEVGSGAASIDPITLELSLLFHPDFRQIREPWPSTDTAAQWADCRRYKQACRWEAFIDACRHWSYDVAAGDREIYASAYAYLLLQLKYSETDKALIHTLLDSVRRSFQASFR